MGFFTNRDKKEKKSQKHSDRKKPEFSETAPDTGNGNQEVTMHNPENFTFQNPAAEDDTVQEMPQQPVQKKPFDDEAEERKAQQQNSEPTNRDAAQNPKDDGVEIEPMSFRRNRSDLNDPYASSNNYVDPYDPYPAQTQQAAEAIRIAKARLSQYEEQLRQREEWLKALECRLMDEQNRISGDKQMLSLRQGQLEARERQLHERSAAVAMDAERIIAEAREKAEAERKEILAHAADSEVRALVRDRLSGYFDENAAQEEAFRKSLSANYAETTQAHAQLISNMDNNAQAIQLTLGQSVNEALSKIQGVRDQMMQELDGWRRQLYKAQYRDFGVCYANLDKLILGMERRLAKELAEGDNGYHPELAEELKRYIKNIKVLRSTFERCLSNLGIRAFYPEPGTPFNSFYHTLETLDPMTQTDDEFNDLPITGCSKPGLVKVTETGEEPLLTAVVTIDPNSP